MKTFKQLTISALVALNFISVGSAKKPNFVLIMADNTFCSSVPVVL